MKSARLFSRDFTLMVIGQIISLFGNAVLRFALPLPVLDATGSAAAFGGISALAMVPALIFGPLGGVLADRAPGSASCGGWTFSPPPWYWGTPCSSPGAGLWGRWGR